MQITREDTGTLTASVKLMISKEDYEDKVTKALRDYQKKTNMPGFRPGKVPFGVVSKMYRKSVLLDEINQLISENLQKYIEESQLKLIGSPVPNKEKAAKLDLDSQSDFEFFFDIGLSPEFDLDLSENFTVDSYTITATEKMIDENIEDLRKRTQSQQDNTENTEEEKPQEELPELNESFFNQVFPGQEIKEIADFREKIKEVIEQSLIKESERYFLNSVIEKLVEETGFELPDDFLKKMIRENEEKKLTDEEIDAQYSNFASSIRWQLIESKIIREHNLKVEESEMRDAVKGYFSGHVVNPEDDPQHDDRLDKIVDQVLSNKEEANRLHDQLFDQKLLNFFRSKAKVESKEIDYDEFVKMVTQKKA